MIAVNDDMSIYMTRGDNVAFSVTLTLDGVEYVFKTGDVVRFKVFEKNNCSNVVLVKDFEIESETNVIQIELDSDETKIGDVINKPKDYWYEIELNPLTKPQTVIGYDEDGAKILRLFPEGADN